MIALKEENCTVCMLCARSCPDWCIYIEGHKEQRPPRREGGRPRSVSVLDRFDIDYALCMYCGICVEVCPFDALFWRPEFEYSEPRIADLLHDKDKLGEWMETVPETEPLEVGAEKGRSDPLTQRVPGGGHMQYAIEGRWSRERRRSGSSPPRWRSAAIGVVRTKNVVHAALYLVVVLAGGAAQFILLGQEFVAWVQVLVYIGAVIVLFLFGIMLTRAPMHPEESLDNDLRWPGVGRVAVPRRACSAGCCRHVPRRQDRLHRADPHRPRSRTRSSPTTSSRSKSSACCCSAR